MRRPQAAIFLAKISRGLKTSLGEIVLDSEEAGQEAAVPRPPASTGFAAERSIATAA
jgi:hypothetical protein